MGEAKKPEQAISGPWTITISRNSIGKPMTYKWTVEYQGLNPYSDGTGKPYTHNDVPSWLKFPEPQKVPEPEAASAPVAKQYYPTHTARRAARSDRNTDWQAKHASSGKKRKAA